MNPFASYVRTDTKKLDALKKAIDEVPRLRVRVGILGGHVQRPLDPSGLRHASGARKRTGSASRFNPDGSRDDELNNPTLGVIHEFGTPEKTAPLGDGREMIVHHSIPARSFLRVPLSLHLGPKVYALGKAFWRDLILRKGIRPALKALGIAGEAVVHQAFETRGFGQWAPNTAATIARKGSSAPLIDSAQLRKSVTSAVTSAGGDRPT